MIAKIYSLDENGKIIEEAMYSLPTKKSLIAFVYQKKGDYNTWLYPEEMNGIWESKKVKNVFYYYDKALGKTYQATTYKY